MLVKPPRLRDWSDASSLTFTGVHSRLPNGYGKESDREIAPYTPVVTLIICLALSIFFIRRPNVSDPDACPIDSKF